MGHDIEKIRRLYTITRDIKKTADFYNKGRSQKNHISQNKVLQIVEGISNSKQKLLPGIIIFASLIIITSIFHMGVLVAKTGEYIRRYSYLPGWLFFCRYSFSWIQRIVGLYAGIGLLQRKDIGRKILIFLGIFTMIFVPWKHPYNEVLDKQLLAVEQQLMSSSALTLFKDPHMFFMKLTIFSMSVIWLSEILFWYIAIKYLTSRKVKQLYKREDV